MKGKYKVINDQPDLAKLFELAKIDSTRPFGEIVNSRVNGFEQLKQKFMQKVEWHLSFNATTFEEEKQKEIALVNGWFANKEDSSIVILDVKEATPFIRLGFELMRNNPSTSFYHIYNDMLQDEDLINLSKLNRGIYAAPMVDSSLMGLKYNEVSHDVIDFEALDYVIDGGQFALYLNYLKTAANELQFNQHNPLIEKSTESGKYFSLIMKKYFERGCKVLTDSDMASIYLESGDRLSLKKNKLNERNEKLALQKYTYNENKNSIKQFAELYKLLIQDFEKTNPEACQEVRKRYEILKSDYETLSL